MYNGISGVVTWISRIVVAMVTSTLQEYLLGEAVLVAHYAR
jgi:hypothetical protein